MSDSRDTRLKLELGDEPVLWWGDCHVLAPSQKSKSLALAAVTSDGIHLCSVANRRVRYDWIDATRISTVLGGGVNVTSDLGDSLPALMVRIDTITVLFAPTSSADGVADLERALRRVLGVTPPSVSEPDEDATRQVTGQGERQPLRRARSGFALLAVRGLDEPATDFFPSPTAETDRVEAEEEDGEDVAVSVATSIEVRLHVGGVTQRQVRVSGIEAILTATSCRLHVACSQYESTGSRWWGLGVGGLTTALILNLTEKAIAAYRRRGQMMVGHIRYPWIETVMFQAGTQSTRPAVRVVFGDPLGDATLAATFELHKRMDADIFATDLAVLAAVHLIEAVPNMPRDEIAFLDDLIEAPLPRLSRDGYWAGYALTPTDRWLNPE